MKLVTAVLLIVASELCFGKVPSWAKENTITKNGQYVTSTCEGTGPSVAVARQVAIQNCQFSVSQFLNGEVKINSLSVETERNVGYHQQVEQNIEVKNFNCEPLKDEIIQNSDGYAFWIKCRFNTKQILTLNKVSSPQVNDVGLKSVAALKSKDVMDGKILVLETIPQCDSILIKGMKARTIECATNPLSLVLYEKDEQLIIRLKSYQPKTINLKEGIKNEKLSVLLERN